jgi:hypothetical protein
VSRRSTLAGLAIVLVVAVAVPALAQVDAVFRTPPKKIDNQLRKLAHKANRKAIKALRIARSIQGGTQGPAGPVGPAGPAGASPSAPFFAEAAGAQSTDEDLQFVQLAGGPTVDVTVPQATNAPAGTGFIEVTASAVIGESSGGVALFEDGAPMPGQSDYELCQGLAPGPVLFVSPDLSGSGFGSHAYGTPAAPDPVAGGCSSSGAPSAVVFETTPGAHTYELRYAYCGCDPPPADATFSERKLWVTPLG